jgi:hypothetical protein
MYTHMHTQGDERDRVCEIQADFVCVFLECGISRGYVISTATSS